MQKVQSKNKIKENAKMASFDYEIWTKSISFKFRCPKCGEITESGEIEVPYPDSGADNFMDSEVREEHEYQCRHCGRIVDVDIISRVPYGTVVLHALDDEDLVQYDCIEDDDFEDFGFYTDSHEALEAIGSLSGKVKRILYQLLYANAIAYMENYLCTKAKEHIMKDAETIRAFVEKWDDCSAGLRRKKKELLSLENKFLRINVAHYLNDYFSYHNLKKTRKLFKDVFEIDLGDTERLECAVSLRHDIVHRNGRKLDGQELSITKQDVEKVWDEVFELRKCIDSQIADQMMKDILSNNAQ